MKLVVTYVAAAVFANLAIAVFGPGAAVVTAFVLIGLNITVRDQLHDDWQGPDLVIRMLGLILISALISYLIVPNAGRIGMASAIAFIASESVDGVIYNHFRYDPWIFRTNVSNVGAALVDSLLFPTIAFATLLPAVVLLQFGAKVTGGFLWAYVLRNRIGDSYGRRRDNEGNRAARLG